MDLASALRSFYSLVTLAQLGHFDAWDYRRILYPDLVDSLILYQGRSNPISERGEGAKAHECRRALVSVS